MAFEEELSPYAPESIVKLHSVLERRTLFGRSRKEIRLEGPKVLVAELMERLLEEKD